jgi:hypothetical protein
MQHELILHDELNNSYNCRFISTDNIDKCAICIVDLLHITNNILTYGTNLYHYDNHNDIYWTYNICSIYNINNVSITCKLFFIGSEDLEKQLYAHMIPNNIHNKNPIWEIYGNIILDPVFDYDICKILNEENEFVFVIIKKNYFNPNTFTIRKVNTDEYKYFKYKNIYSHINIVNNSYINTKNGNKIFKNWCKSLSFHINLNIESNEKNIRLEYIKEESTEIKINESEVQLEIQDENQDEVQFEIQDEVQSEIQDEIQDEVQSEIQNEVQSEIQQKEIKKTNKIDYSSLIKKEVNKSIEKDTFCNNIVKVQNIENDTFCDNVVEVQNIENDTFYDNVVEVQNIENDTFYDNVVEVQDNLLTISSNNIEKENKKPTNSKNENHKLKKSNKKKKNNSKNENNFKNENNSKSDIILNVLACFDDFYEKNIIKECVDKNTIYDRYSSVLLSYDDSFLNQKTEIIVHDILNTFRVHVPNILINEKNIYKSVDENMKEMAIKLKNQSNEKFLIPFIKPFKLMFRNIFNDIDPVKKKVLLIYYSLSDKDNLINFLGMIPSLLLEDENGIMSNNGYVREEKVTIFHMDYMYNIFSNYILKLLFKKYKTIPNNDYKDMLIKLLYQYFSCFIVHTELTALMIVKNTTYDNLIELIQYHLQFLFPSFRLGFDTDYSRLNTISNTQNRYMLKYRILTSSLLKTLNINKYYTMAGFMSKLLSNYFYSHETGNIINYINDKDVRLNYFFEDYLKKEFFKASKSLDN